MIASAGLHKMAQATQKQLKKYSDIAVAIREGMARRGWTVGQLNEALGKNKGSPAAYYWYHGRGAPGKDIIPVLARVLQIPIESLQWRNKDKVSTSTNQLVVAPVKTSVVKAAEPNDVVNFNITPDGKAHIKFEWTMPLEQGNQLFRSVMDLYQMTRSRR